MSPSSFGMRRARRGMTLVELLVVAGIFIVIMGAVTLFEANVFSYQSTASSSYTTVQDAEVALKIMTKEIRGAATASNGSYAVQTAGTSTMTFYDDVYGDGKKERIRYTFSDIDGVIYRAEVKPVGTPATYPTANESTTTIVRNLRNGTSTPLFEYFDGTYDGSQAALPQPVAVTDVRLVKITLLLDPDPNKVPVPRTYSAQVTLRNLKDNL